MSQAERPSSPMPPAPRSEPPSKPSSAWGRLRQAAPDMRYPNAYLWLILFSTMDVMLTWKILSKGGTELNPVAKMVLDYWNERWGDPWDLWGAIAFKFCLMIFFIIACEVVGRQRDIVGRWLARVAVVVSAFPVFYSLGLLWYHMLATNGGGGGA
ncbi:MAG: DUF5658 family protein [Planctomycetota bacterium]|nr:DUF5658 family protein [Planctomycetota bacterium]